MTAPTDVADTGLARQRTALAWTRTGLSFAVAGAVLLRLAPGPRAVGLVVAVGFVALGSVAWGWGWQTAALHPAIDTRTGRAVVRTIALGTAVLAVVGGVATAA